MKEENKQEIKKNIITSVSTAAGAVLGSVIENAFQATAVGAKEIGAPELKLPESRNSELKIEEAIERLNAISNDLKHSQFLQSIEENGDSSMSESAEGDELMVGQLDESMMGILMEGEVIMEGTIMSEPLNTEPLDGETELVYSDDGDQLLMDSIPEEDATDDEDERLSGFCDYDTASLDMPDYVHDANVDSFIDLA